MFVIAARPAVGKTSLALNIAQHVAVDLALPVGFISLEMTAAELTKRLISSRAKVSSCLMEKGELTQEQIKAITRAAAPVRKAPLHISDVGEMRVPQLQAKSAGWLGAMQYGCSASTTCSWSTQPSATTLARSRWPRCPVR